MSRDTEINIKLTKEAKAIYDKAPYPKNRFVSAAIIEKHKHDKGSLFTVEQEQQIKKWIAEAIKEVGK